MFVNNIWTTIPNNSADLMTTSEPSSLSRKRPVSHRKRKSVRKENSESEFVLSDSLEEEVSKSHKKRKSDRSNVKITSRDRDVDDANVNYINAKYSSSTIHGKYDWESKPVDEKKLKIFLDHFYERVPLTETKLTKRNRSELTSIYLKILIAIREAIVSHRYRAASTVIPFLPTEMATVSHAAYNAGMQIIRNLGDDELRGSFVRSFNELFEFSSKDIVLDQVVDLLADNKIHEAKELMSIHGLRRSLIGKRKKTRGFEMIYLLFCGYEGLIAYLLWKDTLNAQGTENENRIAKDDKLLRNLARQAIKQFSHVLKYPGLWDIFVTKYLHILLHNEQYIDAEEMLRNYVGMNPTNCNAHVYLCEYLSRYDAPHDEQQSALKNFAEVCPYHPSVLKLAEQLSEEGDVCGAVLYVFSFLDHASNRHNLEGWKMLKNLLDDIYNNQRTEAKEAVVDCWTKRIKWWPRYHFNSGRGSNQKLNCIRKTVAKYLNKFHSYSEKI